MSLRIQLLTVGALTLLLPWVGILMVREVEAVLRNGLESSLLDSARARVVATELPLSPALERLDVAGRDLSPSLYAPPLTRPPVVDGFRRDWSFTRDLADTATDVRATVFDDGSRFWLGINGGNLFLFIEVNDDEIVYQGVPGEPPHGDRIAIVTGSDQRNREVLSLANSAAGVFRAQASTGSPRFAPTGSYYENVYGAWSVTETGYAVEARLPLSLVGNAIGIAVIDSDNGGATAELSATTWNESGAPNTLVRESDELNRILRRFSGGDDRVRILDPDGWVIADSGPLRGEASTSAAQNPSLGERFLRYVLRRDDPEYESQESRPARIGDARLRAALTGREATAWFRRGADVSAIVAAAIPIDAGDAGKGVLLLEQATDPILTSTNQAMMRVLATTGIIIVIATAGLLAFASLLSFRVGRLARAAAGALGPRGEINPRLPGMTAGDEIGELSRAFADLLGRLREYTSYLQSLKSKLTHELRTPLTIVATSLDNLEHELGRDSGRSYLERLRHGTSRLDSILQAMTAATRVEQAIADTDRERFDLDRVVSSCVLAYEDVYPDRGFTIRRPPDQVWVEGSAELIEQMLDKLVDNAAGFSPAGSTIEITLTADGKTARLDVVNRGPQLPDTMRHRLFDSLVSVRPGGGDKPHLGLGLYIVMLVVEFHDGQVTAENLADGSGVMVRVALPRANADAT